MTPKQIIQAYTAMEELVGIALPYHTTRQLAALRKCLGEEFHIVSETETNLRKKHGGEITQDKLFLTSGKAFWMKMILFNCRQLI